MKFFAAISFLLFLSDHALADTADTPAHLDTTVYQQQSWQFYGDPANRAGEQGRCVVRVMVTVAGTSLNEKIETSSGHPGDGHLDEACLRWVHYFRWVPATHNGHAVQSSISVPIEWRPRPDLSGAYGMVNGVAIDLPQQ